MLQALLWGFHNTRSGLCFPSYESIAEKADCARSTVAEAIKTLEDAGLLSWVNRITRVRERCEDLFGRFGTRWRVIRTSNGYRFHDPNADHLRAIHRHLFQDVYEWAGHTRDEPVPLSDGTIASEPVMHKPGGADFLIGRFIPDALDGFAKMLRDADYLRRLSRGHFAARAADIMAFLNAIHPFREGNGRTQRIFLQELAQDAGHGLDFSVVSKERMIAASIAANDHDDPNMMRRSSTRSAILYALRRCGRRSSFSRGGAFPGMTATVPRPNQGTGSS